MTNLELFLVCSFLVLFVGTDMLFMKNHTHRFVLQINNRIGCWCEASCRAND